MGQKNMAGLMGAVVIVHEVYKREKRFAGTPPRREVKWEAVRVEGRPGWVVGERWLQDGIVRYYNSYEDPPEWKPNGTTHHCLLICYWPTLRPVCVPMWGYLLAGETVQPYPPVHPIFDKDWRACQREIMEAWPRDEKGRWVKKCQPSTQNKQ